MELSRRGFLKLSGGTVGVSIVGVGMRSHSGIAGKMFQALADNNINIQMISTSEIKISCIISKVDVETAVRALHDSFELGEISTGA